MRKAAHHLGGVVSLNPHRWRVKRLHHHGGGVCWLFVLLWMELWRHETIVCKFWYKNNLSIRTCYPSYLVSHICVHHTWCFQITRWKDSLEWMHWWDNKSKSNHGGSLWSKYIILLAPTGEDFSMVQESERESNDLSCLTYNLENKMILQQFEGAAAPAKYLCLFLQDKKYTWSDVLFTIWVILKQTMSETFAIVADISYMDHTVDLCKCGDKTILVKKEGGQIIPEAESNNVRVDTMHPLIAKYWSLYSGELCQQLGLNETRLKHELTLSVLLNAWFGLQKRIVGAKLLTATQYSRANAGKFVCLHVSSSATILSFSKKFVRCTMSPSLSRKCKIILMPSTHHSLWIVMTEIAMTVVALMGILLKRPTITILGQKRNSILVNPSNVTSTVLNGWRPNQRFLLV